MALFTLFILFFGVAVGLRFAIFRVALAHLQIEAVLFYCVPYIKNTLIVHDTPFTSIRVTS